MNSLAITAGVVLALALSFGSSINTQSQAGEGVIQNGFILSHVAAVARLFRALVLANVTSKNRRAP